MRLLVATRNPKKRQEIEQLLAGLPVEVLTLEDVPGAPEVTEDGATLEANAAKKAGQVARACRMHAVADDSGLFVEALDGRPGVLSARYADGEPSRENLCRKLLSEMTFVPREERRAHFRCCIALADAEGNVVLTSSGRVDGVIADHMVGDGGFGYDPVFYYRPAGKTFAQMSAEEKNSVSHRGLALRKLRQQLTEYLRPQSRGVRAS